MKIVESTVEKIPEYSLSYLINSDSSGITQDDIEIIDKWLKSYQDLADHVNGFIEIELVNSEIAESYFSWYPAFGLACTCYDCNVMIVK
jgi:hypothetical protein